jgi:salicylate hydroxylase
MLALALASYPDLEINVYEAASRFEQIGAGFTIWGRGATVLKKLGMEEKIRKIAPPTGNGEYPA